MNKKSTELASRPSPQPELAKRDCPLIAQASGPCGDTLEGAAETSSRRGRPITMGTAERDFALFDAHDLYQQRRAELGIDKTGGRDASPDAPRMSRSERTLVYVLERMGKALDNISTGRLRNLFSVFRDVPAEWEAPDCPVEHEELEATCPPQRTKANFRECSERPDGVQPNDTPKEDAKS